MYYLLLAPDYVIFFNCAIFEYNPSISLKKADFNLLYPGFSYEGKMRISTFENCYRELNELLIYECENKATPEQIEKIKKTFWGVVEKYVELPAAVSFKFHEKRPYSVFWDCSYIFLNKSKGIYICMMAND